MNAAAPLGSVAQIVTGKTPPKNRAEFYGGTTPFVTPAELDGSDPVVSAKTTLTAAGADVVKRIPPGSVMVSCIGSLGKVGYAGTELCTNQQINAIIANEDKLHPRYAYHYCRTLKAQLESMAPATTLAIVNKSRFSKIEIPLPALPEQRRIAARLDQADALIKKRERAIQLLDELAAAVFHDMFGDPVLNEEGWNTVPLGDVLSGIDSGRSPKCHARPAAEGEWGVLKLGAITTGRFNPTENKALPDHEELDPTNSINHGDLLFTRKNTPELVGACAVVRNQPTNLLLPDLIFRLNLHLDLVHPEFLAALMMSPGKRRQIQGLAGGSAGSMPNISKAKLRLASIELPPISLQREFASRIHQLEQSRAGLRSNSFRFATLKSSVQDLAFGGSA